MQAWQLQCMVRSCSPTICNSNMVASYKMEHHNAPMVCSPTNTFKLNLIACNIQCISYKLVYLLMFTFAVYVDAYTHMHDYQGRLRCSLLALLAMLNTDMHVRWGVETWDNQGRLGCSLLAMLAVHNNCSHCIYMHVLHWGVARSNWQQVAEVPRKWVRSLFFTLHGATQQARSIVDWSTM